MRAAVALGLLLALAPTAGFGAPGDCLDAASAAEAQACVIAREAAEGRDASALGPVYEAIAARLQARHETAAEAIFFRRRAHALAERLHGADSPEAAAAALAAAKAWILVGRCTVDDPRAGPLLAQAEAGFARLAAADARRRPGLLAVAQARADVTDFAAAADLVAGLSPLATDEVERMGDWRRLADDPAGAAAAWEAALASARAARDARAARRLVKNLRALYFETGDLVAAARLGAE